MSVMQIGSSDGTTFSDLDLGSAPIDSQASKVIRQMMEGDKPSGGEPADPAKPKRMLNDRYLLVRLIGEGGFGSVWEGYDSELRCRVAIKIPRPGRRILEEAQRMAQLRHEGIVPVHNVGTCKEGCFIVSDLIDGSDLRRHLLAGALPLQAALRIAAEIAEALHHAHLQGFVHRDVKPGNILVDSSGRVFVTDFGIAATEEELRQQGGRRCGTPGYMSPEQLGGRNVDCRADVYSLGVVLGEMLTGERPTAGGTSTTWRGGLRQNDSARPLRAMNASLPKEAERICTKCLAEDPANRYPTALAAAKDLRRMIARINTRRVSLSVMLAGATLLLAGYNLVVLYQRMTDPTNWRGGDNEATVLRGIKKLYLDRDYDGALRDFEAAEFVRPSALVYELKGEAHFGLGQHHEAMESAKKALRHYPRFWPALNLKATIYQKRGHDDEAAKCARESLEIANPDAINILRKNGGGF